jgi:rubrerythrin
MADETREPRDEGRKPEEKGETVPLNWACTNCGYHVEGEPPERCPECGAAKSEFEEVPIPGF